MKRLKISILTLLFTAVIVPFSMAQDWPDLNRFKAENANLVAIAPNEIKVVFMGNSIMEGWINLHPEFFAGKFYINRGISGQTTPQMLLRFRADVIRLKPKVVVILAGTNDIAGNTGPSTLGMIEDNLISMGQLAKANNIKVILCSVLPVYDYPWKPGLKPADKIIELNALIKSYAEKNEMIYLDFFSAVVDERNGLKAEYSKDGVHPNDAGYKVMEPLTENAISKAIGVNKPVVRKPSTNHKPTTTRKTTTTRKPTTTHKTTSTLKKPNVPKKK